MKFISSFITFAMLSIPAVAVDLNRLNNFTGKKCVSFAFFLYDFTGNIKETGDINNVSNVCNIELTDVRHIFDALSHFSPEVLENEFTEDVISELKDGGLAASDFLTYIEDECLSDNKGACATLDGLYKVKK